LIYVGKRAGLPSITQEEINHLLIARAREGRTVARLKGGDPFVFGRGGEEAEALAAADIKWEVVPGVSSGIAAAAYAGIPLTHRGYSSSVAFITGHDGPKRREDVDWSVAAHLADTLVIFMCAEAIMKIAGKLIENGRPPSTPIAIVRWGTYEHQEVFSGTLKDLIEADEDTDFGAIKITPPAIAIVGDVVSLRERLHWFGQGAFNLSLLRPIKLKSEEPYDGCIA
jgi:uroporphyrin-III C-methyltransferase